MRAQLIALLACAALTACAGTYFKWDDVAKVKTGMRESEVTAILGAPYMRTQSGNTSILTWSFAGGFDGARAVSYKFVDGRVATITTLNQ